MRIEIPECTRCCVCVPLRYGLIIFGYLNLALTILLFSFEIFIQVVYYSEYSVAQSLQSYSMFMYRGVAMSSQAWFVFFLYCLEIIFNVVLLIGAHRKIPKLLRAYYYYGITTCLAVFLCFVIIREEETHVIRSTASYVTEFSLAFSAMVFQIYLLLLIRSELKKLDERKGVHFINHTAEVYVNQLSEDKDRTRL